MKILIKQKCSNCNGAGVVWNAIWDDFYKADDIKKNETGENYTQEECEDWFRERGYWELPPEEPKCSECNGEGEIQQWMPVEEIIEHCKKLNRD